MDTYDTNESSDISIMSEPTAAGDENVTTIEEVQTSFVQHANNANITTFGNGYNLLAAGFSAVLNHTALCPPETISTYNNLNECLMSMLTATYSMPILVDLAADGYVWQVRAFIHQGKLCCEFNLYAPPASDDEKEEEDGEEDDEMLPAPPKEVEEENNDKDGGEGDKEMDNPTGSVLDVG